MVIPTMTFYEMYEELASDRPKIEYKRQQLIPKAVKKFRKTLRFPAWELFENPEFNYFSIINVDSRRFVLKWGCSPYKHTESDSMVWTRRIDAYSTHFFSRYRERVFKNTELGLNEVICRYFTRNKIALLIELNEDIKKNYQKYGGAAHRAMKVSDGLCFIRTSVECLVDLNTQKETAEALGFVYVTFVDDNTLTNSQNEATFMEGIRSSQKIFKDLIADIKD